MCMDALGIQYRWGIETYVTSHQREILCFCNSLKLANKRNCMCHPFSNFCFDLKFCSDFMCKSSERDTSQFWFFESSSWILNRRRKKHVIAMITSNIPKCLNPISSIYNIYVSEYVSSFFSLNISLSNTKVVVHWWQCFISLGSKFRNIYVSS